MITMPDVTVFGWMSFGAPKNAKLMEIREYVQLVDGQNMLINHDRYQARQSERYS